MKGLTVALCLDDEGGIAFNNRRQSRDRAMIAELCQSSHEKIYISEYSLPLFAGHEESIEVCGNPITECPNGGFCFLEKAEPKAFLSYCENLVIYWWGQSYPYDVSFDIVTLSNEFTVIGREEFVGSSHEKITKEVYKRCER